MSNDKYESITTKLNKLKALAERGYKGEAENAKRLLEKLCAQYGIPLEEIFDAYIAKHHLSSRQRNDDDTEEMEELSVEDFRHLQQVMQTMNLLNDNKYPKMIES